ncbi:hypothetical protein [Chitinophaga polysaccharea]|uniref:hypothetical protein n=1 Tax=Chitinophaga polysaccharea TaxID=1293035 RepID=UPI001158C5EA|nr:hypothetical protein [Chitinophaga polysaccharea]
MEHQTTIKYRDGSGPHESVFSFAVNEIKNKSEKAGTPIADDEIAEALLITREEYSKYLTADSCPLEILQLLATKFKDFSTLEIVEFSSYERAIQPPPTPDPDEPDDE